MAARHTKRPKTEFGVEVTTFAAETGMPIKKLAEKSGVKYVTLLETMVGKSPGYQVVPAVRKYISKYRSKAIKSKDT